LHFITPVCLAMCAVCLPLKVSAQEPAYPLRPVRFIVTTTPSGPADGQARLIAEQLSNILQRQFIVDNRAGASGRIGVDIAAKSTADGHTLLLGSQGTQTIHAFFHKNLPYDPVKDFAPVILSTRVRYLLLAAPGLPATNLQELLSLVRSRSEPLLFASTGTGSSGHLAGELFKKMMKFDMTHVPYKGVASAAVDIVSGQVHLMFGTPIASLPYLMSGRFKAIAISAPQRSSMFPNVPMFAELGMPNFEASIWFGIVVPTGTPANIITVLNTHINRILLMEESRRRLALLDAEPAGGTPDEFAQFLRNERLKWGTLIRETGLKAD
jgi:tripartite-type tricarboxylate transporter receptor subunit TctC